MWDADTVLSAVQIGPLEPVGPLKMDQTGPASTRILCRKAAKNTEKTGRFCEFYGLLQRFTAF